MRPGTTAHVISPYKRQVSLFVQVFVSFPVGIYVHALACSCACIGVYDMRCLPFVVQVNLVRRVLALKKTGQTKFANLTVDAGSSDSVQGDEFDIVIYSVVRSTDHEKADLNWINEERRLNVSITRAKFGLIVVGNSRTLAKELQVGLCVCFQLVCVCVFWW